MTIGKYGGRTKVIYLTSYLAMASNRQEVSWLAIYSYNTFKLQKCLATIANNAILPLPAMTRLASLGK